MFGILMTILLVGAFFILFFKSPYNLKKEKKKEGGVSSTVEYVEDTGLESYGDVMKPGDTGTFVSFSTIPDDNWLSGYPHLEDTEYDDNVPKRLITRELAMEELKESLSVS
tara:strand:+ start:1327 stop:1659 length:333 start_codon:yes stop_codon:yes gene_type:complete